MTIQNSTTLTNNYTHINASPVHVASRTNHWKHHRSGSHTLIDGGRALWQWRGVMLPRGGSLWSMVRSRTRVVFLKMLKKRVVRVPNCEVKKKVGWGGNQGIFWRVKRVKRWSAGGFFSDFFSVLRVCPKFSTYIVWHCLLVLISCTWISDWKKLHCSLLAFASFFVKVLKFLGLYFAADVWNRRFFFPLFVLWGWNLLL